MTRSYHLQNIAESHRADPRHFLKPTDKEIAALKPGDEVRLFFVMDFKTDDNCRAERMWVEISEINGDHFKGYLVNEPYYIKDLKEGDLIEFTKDNIATLIVPSAIEENTGALISFCALDNLQINRVFWESPSRAEDSGWLLLYGDEDEEYLKNPENFTLVTLGTAMDIEPRLEFIFSKYKSGEFEWDEESLSFEQIMERCMLDKGISAFNEERYEAAINDLTHFIDNTSDNPLLVKAYYYRGSAYQYIEDYKQAIEDYNKALDQNPDNFGVLFQLANCKRHLGEFEEAIKIYNTVIDEDARNEEAIFNRGLCYFRLRQYESALKDFQSAHRLKNTDTYYISYLALTYQQLDRLSESLDAYKLLISLDQGDANSYAGRGMVYNDLGNYKAALQDFNTSLEINSGNAYNLFHRAKTKNALGDFDGADKDYKEAISIDPDEFIFYGAGMNRFDMGDENGATHYFKKALEINPYHPKSLYSVVVSLQSRGEYQESINMLNNFLQEIPDDSYALKYRSFAYRQLKDYDKALSDINTAINLDTDNPDLYDDRGVIKYLLEDFDGAIADTSEAIKIDPSYEEYYRNRAMAYYAQENYMQTGKDFNKILSLDPDNEFAKNALKEMNIEIEPQEDKNVQDAPGYIRSILSAPQSENAKRLEHRNDSDENKRERILEESRANYWAEIASGLGKNYPLKGIENYTKAIGLDPSAASYYCQRGILKAFTDNFNGAMADFNMAIQLNPKYYNAYHQRAKAAEAVKNYEVTISDYQKLLQLYNIDSDDITASIARVKNLVNK